MQRIWQVLNRPLIIKPSVRRILVVAGSTSVLVLLSSCIYALLPRSWSTSETPAQLVRRAEGTYALKFPTNMIVIKSKAWIQHLPRSSPGRCTAIHFTCNASAWNQLAATFGTNFMWMQQSAYLAGYKVEKKIPWITATRANGHNYLAEFKTRDADGWLRIHWVNIYVDNLQTPRNVIFYSWDHRSEINW